MKYHKPGILCLQCVRNEPWLPPKSTLEQGLEALYFVLNVPKDSQRLLQYREDASSCFMLFFCTCSASPLLFLLAMEKSHCLKLFPGCASQLLPFHERRGGFKAVAHLPLMWSCVLSARHGCSWAFGNCLGSAPALGVSMSLRCEGTCGVLPKQDQLWDQTRLLRALLQAGLENLQGWSRHNLS